MITSGVLLTIILIGFSPSFYLKLFFEAPELPFYLHVHGAVLTAWFTLVFVQTTLIASHRTDLHRRLGLAGLVLAVLVVIISALTNYFAIPRLVSLASPEEIPEILAEARFIVFGNFATLLFFAISVGTAAYLRHRPEIHKRLMLIASLSIVGPAIDRPIRLSGVENVLQLTDLATLVLLTSILGADWYIRRRPPWVLLGGSMVLIGFFSIVGVLATTDTVQSWIDSMVNQQL